MVKNNKMKTNKNVFAPLLGLDMFKAQFGLQYDKGKSSMGTCIGAMLTISLAILSIVFAGQKFILVAE